MKTTTTELTAREQEIFMLAGEGLSQPEIAARLHGGSKTAEAVRAHERRIRDKRGYPNRAKMISESAKEQERACRLPAA